MASHSDLRRPSTSPTRVAGASVVIIWLPSSYEALASVPSRAPLAKRGHRHEFLLLSHQFRNPERLRLYCIHTGIHSCLNLFASSIRRYSDDGTMLETVSRRFSVRQHLELTCINFPSLSSSRILFVQVRPSMTGCRSVNEILLERAHADTYHFLIHQDYGQLNSISELDIRLGAVMPIRRFGQDFKGFSSMVCLAGRALAFLQIHIWYQALLTV